LAFSLSSLPNGGSTVARVRLLADRGLSASRGWICVLTESYKVGLDGGNSRHRPEPLLERAANEFYDPLRWIFRKLSGK
jgi:hypothetical protein